MVVNFLGAFITGFILAYVRSWRLALAMSSMLPCIAIAECSHIFFMTGSDSRSWPVKPSTTLNGAPDICTICTATARNPVVGRAIGQLIARWFELLSTTYMRTSHRRVG